MRKQHKGILSPLAMDIKPEDIKRAARQGGKTNLVQEYVRGLIQEATTQLDIGNYATPQEWRTSFLLMPDPIANAVHIGVGKKALPTIDTF